MPFFPPLVVKGNLRISSNVSIYLLNRKKVGSALENRSIILLMVCFARYIIKTLEEEGLLLLLARSDV